jgi:hypothetical protein
VVTLSLEELRHQLPETRVVVHVKNVDRIVHMLLL